MISLKAPDLRVFDSNVRRDFTLFLAGSIELGSAKKWQDEMTEALKDVKGYIFNPRRDDWDASWEQTIENEQFKTQVKWELDCLENAKYIFMHFEPETKSPITLLELGLHAANANDLGYRKLLVHCPKGFWRKGNVDVTCERYNIDMVDSIEDAILYYGRLRAASNV